MSGPFFLLPQDNNNIDVRIRPVAARKRGYSISMTLDGDVCYHAALARDRRFDGQFFVGVSSTGIFCRPICPAPTPKRAHCTFFSNAAAALEAGFRPCLRCRPEASPEMHAWPGTSQTVRRALRLIHEGALDNHSVEHLAGRLGVGGRHLRRLFEEHVGARPVAVAQARRLLLAKRLLMETGWPMTEIAMASGFGSIRRFNAAFHRTYQRTPAQLRKSGGTSDNTGIQLRLPHREPFDWDGLIAFLSARAIPGMELVTPHSYVRTIRAGDECGRVFVEHQPGRGWLGAQLELPSVGNLRTVIERINSLFDLCAAPDRIAARLDGIAAPGVRVPGAWDPLELAVRAVLGQQISVAGAVTLASRIVNRAGDRLPGEPVQWLFPTASALASADLTGLGLTTSRAETITGLARAVADGKLDFDRFRNLEDAIRNLCQLRGIGEWTAQYIAMRALGEPDAFPAGDLALRKAVSPDRKTPVAEAQLLAMSEAWRPWRAYAAVSLWRRS